MLPIKSFSADPKIKLNFTLSAIGRSASGGKVIFAKVLIQKNPLPMWQGERGHIMKKEKYKIRQRTIHPFFWALPPLKGQHPETSARWFVEWLSPRA